MAQRRRVWLTREGGYYVVILLFVIGAAVLREVNLLVLLAGLMIGPLFLNWRLATMSLRGFRVARHLPRQVNAGDLFRVELTATNSRPLLGSWAVLAREEIHCLTSPGPMLQPTVLFPFVAARSSVRLAYECRLQRRGHYEWKPCHLSTNFPLGLVNAWHRFGESQALIVLPRLGQLLPGWNALLQANRVGGQRSHDVRGLVEGDYYGLREWRSGDSQRWIHWRTSARLGTLAVRQFEQQQRRDIVLLLDLHLPPEPNEREHGLVEIAVSVAATAVMSLVQQSHCQIAVAVAGEPTDCWLGANSALFRQELLERLAVVAGSPTDRLVEALTALPLQATQSSPLIVISTRRCPFDGEVATAMSAAVERRLEQASWVDVSGPDLDRFFALDAV